MALLRPEKGFTLILEGDHEHHVVSLGLDDLPYTSDDFTGLCRIFMEEKDAVDLFFSLMEVIPKLRKDRK